MEHPPHSPDLVPNDFWLFPKIKSALKGRKWNPFHNRSSRNVSNSGSISIKRKAKYRFYGTSMLFYILQKKLINKYFIFAKIYRHAKFQDTVVCVKYDSML
jgi:hypothetical protein